MNLTWSRIVIGAPRSLAREMTQRAVVVDGHAGIRRELRSGSKEEDLGDGDWKRGEDRVLHNVSDGGFARHLVMAAVLHFELLLAFYYSSLNCIEASMCL